MGPSSSTLVAIATAAATLHSGNGGEQTQLLAVREKSFCSVAEGLTPNDNLRWNDPETV